MTSFAAGPAEAHVVSGPEGSWPIGVLLVAALAIYMLGLVRLWRRAGLGRGISGWEAAAYGGGLLALAAALMGPLDVLAERSLAAHMAQHMLLVAVAAPLLLLGRPLPAWLGALPPRSVRVLARLLAKGGGLRRIAAPLAGAGAATLVQALVMWGWHVPAAMELALASEPVHYAMHASFLGAGLLFWWALIRSVREPAAGFVAAAVALVGTMMQMGFLSALLTFAPAPHFEAYVERAAASGASALDDQQLAGLIMWVPSALPYLIAMLALAASWLRRLERADERRTRLSPR